MKDRVIGRLCAIWASVSFITTFLIIYPPAMFTWLVPDPRGQAIFIAISRVWMRVWLRLVGCGLRVVGLAHFASGKSYIVTCNHNSVMDTPLSSPFIPGPNKTIAKAEFKKVPVFNFFYQKGAVLVNRKNEQSRRRSYEEMKKVLAKRMHMCVYPEGTRNRTDLPLKPFHNGAFRLSIDTQHAIIPAVIFHTKKVMPPEKSFYFRPGPLAIHFLEPVSPYGHTVESLKEKVFSIMEAYYVAHNY